MLILNGQLGDKFYNEEAIDARKALEAFGVEVPTEAVEIHMNGLKKDKNGKFIVPNSINLNAEITGTFNGTEVTLRYARRKPIKRENGTYKYFPARLTLKNKRTQFNPKKELDVIAYFLLSPENVNSPIIGTVNRQRIINIDPAKTAKDKMKSWKLIQQAKDRVMKMTEDELRQTAKGIRISGKDSKGSLHTGWTIPNAHKMSVDELQYNILGIADKFPNQFTDVIGNAKVQIFGLIADARDNGHILLKPLSNGNSEWVWSEKLGSSVIIRVQSGQDGFAELFSWVSDPKNTDTFVTKVSSEMSIARGVANLQIPKEKKVEDLSSDELVAYAINEDKIDFSRSEGRIKLVMPDGSLEKQALLVIKGPANEWKTELSKALSDKGPAKGRLLKHLA